MGKLSKRKQAIRKEVNREGVYSPEAAVELLQELSSVKFKESIDVSVNLGVFLCAQCGSHHG